MKPEVYRNRFIEHVSENISDVMIDSVVRDFLWAKVPEPFWTAAASSTGKWHPTYALEEGGLVRHTVVMLHTALDLCEQYNIEEPMKQAVVAACALHDTYKGGPGPKWEKTVDDHPSQAANALWDMIRHAAYSSQVGHIFVISAEAIETHMTMWGPTVSPTHKLQHPVQQVVAVADYIASRKYFEPADDLLTVLEQFYPDELLKEEWRG